MLINNERLPVPTFVEKVQLALVPTRPKVAKKPSTEQLYAEDLLGGYYLATVEQIQDPACEISTLSESGDYLPWIGPRPAATGPKKKTDHGSGDNAEREHATAVLIEELNKTNFISREGGKTYVFSEAWEERMCRNVLHRSSFIDFQNYYLNKLVYAGENKQGEAVYKPLGEVYLKSPQRRQYEGITLEPGKDTEPRFFNLWRGFSIEPAVGRWSLMYDHIFNIICARNDVAFKYVLGWLATAVQKPGEQAEVALVFRGKRGTGKGIVGNYICKAFGGNSAHITSSKYLTGNFNSHLRDVVFLFADEAFWAGDKQGESVLKGIITEPTLTIEGKGRDVVFVRNMLHILMASNNDWVVPAGLEERRFCVLDVSDERMQDKSYFADLVKEMDSGGLAAMLYALQDHDLSRFQIRDVPQTCGLFEQKLQSLDDFMQWWFHRLCEGEIARGENWLKPVPAEKLYNEYISNLADRAIQRRSGQTAFGMSLKKVLPKGWTLRKLHQVETDYQTFDGNKRISHYFFPSLEICRDYFKTLIKFEVDWEA